MTKQEFLSKWGMLDEFIVTNTDFKHILLTNLSNIGIKIDNPKDRDEAVRKTEQLKEFIMDFYSTQEKEIELNFKK
jgi:hypothetical protein